MPAMASITVKNKAGTDVVFAAAVPSAGDRTPARWVQTAASSIPGHRPQFEVGTRTNGNGNGRIMEWNGIFPVVQVVGGVDTVVARIPFKGSATLPLNSNSLTTEDAFVQFGNLLVSALLREIAATGYAPT